MTCRDRLDHTATSCQRFTCAAPHPSLNPHWRTCHVYPAFDEDGTRAPICFSVAENSPRGFCTRHAHGERTSRSVWCSHGGAPAWEITSEHVADGQRCWNPPGGKKAKKPLRGYFCPLTTGGLIRVRGRGEHDAPLPIPPLPTLWAGLSSHTALGHDPAAPLPARTARLPPWPAPLPRRGPLSAAGP